MKKLIFGLLLSGVVSSVFASVGDTPYTLSQQQTLNPLGSPGTDNDFYLVYGDGVESINFYLLGNYDEVRHADSFWKYDDHFKFNKKQYSLYIDWMSDRKGSATTAAKFNDSASGVVAEEVSSSLQPDKLNFYFYGYMNINGKAVVDISGYHPAVMYIGQAHDFGSNPWWFGESKIGLNTYTKNFNLMCIKTEDGKKYWVNEEVYALNNVFEVSEAVGDACNL